VCAELLLLLLLLLLKLLLLKLLLLKLLLLKLLLLKLLLQQLLLLLLLNLKHNSLNFRSELVHNVAHCNLTTELSYMGDRLKKHFLSEQLHTHQ